MESSKSLIESQTSPKIVHLFHRLKKLRAEIAFELLLLLACTIAAITWNQKFVLMAIIACIRFGSPSLVTAAMVLKLDPNRWHGIGVACLFTAWGFTRIAIASSLVVIPSTMIFVLLESQGHKIDWALFSISTCYLIVFWALMSIFPFTLAPFLIAWLTKTPLYFAIGLTQLRRAAADERSDIRMDVRRSINYVGFASTASYTLWACTVVVQTTSFFKLDELYIALAFPVAITLFPILWLYLFIFVLRPQGE